MSRKSLPSSELLLKIKEHKGVDISIFEILRIFREGSFTFFLIIFAGPVALPLPAVGVASILSIPILVATTQLMMGRSYLWLPKWMGKKKVDMKTMSKLIDSMMPYIKKIEYFLKPRIYFLSTKAGHVLVGAFATAFALSVALPLPFTNTVPSMGIVLMALGLLERDGIFIIAGMVVGSIGLVITSCIIYFGTEAVKAVIYSIF